MLSCHAAQLPVEADGGTGKLRRQGERLMVFPKLERIYSLPARRLPISLSPSSPSIGILRAARKYKHQAICHCEVYDQIT